VELSTKYSEGEKKNGFKKFFQQVLRSDILLISAHPPFLPDQDVFFFRYFFDLVQRDMFEPSFVKKELFH
jgi:hypothetical protein